EPTAVITTRVGHSRHRAARNNFCFPCSIQRLLRRTRVSLIPQRLNRIQIRRPHRGEHSAHNSNQRENGGSDQQYFRRDDQSHVGGFGVFGESAIKGQTSD